MQVKKDKPYLEFSHPRPGMKAFLFKKAAQLNAEKMRLLELEEHREALDRLAEVRLIAPGTRIFPVACGEVPCEWVYRDDSPEDKAILYLHGGSWSFGNLRTARAVGTMLCWASGYRVLVAEYRLSPEHPYPAGADDCAAVFAWLVEQGFPPSAIALFGDSAGGNLSLSLLQRLKAQGRPLPAALGLASPVPDVTEDSFLMRNPPDQLFSQYQGQEADLVAKYCGPHKRIDPLLSPVYGDLADFPPTLIHVGGDEDLCYDCDLFAQKAHRAGVNVHLKIWRDMYHDFTIVGVTLKESRQSLEEFGDFFRKHFG